MFFLLVIFCCFCINAFFNVLLLPRYCLVVPFFYIEIMIHRMYAFVENVLHATVTKVSLFLYIFIANLTLLKYLLYSNLILTISIETLTLMTSVPL